MQKSLALSLLAVPLLAIMPAQASIVYDLTSQHCDPNNVCGPTGTTFGTITLTDNGANTVNMTVSLNSPYEFVNTGFDTDIGFNLGVSPDPTISGTAASGWSFTTTTPGSLHMDGTGYFEYGFTCTACGTGGSNPQTGPYTFTITGTGLTAANFGEQNAAGNFFAVDIINTSTTGPGAGLTGAVDASQSGTVRTTATPEPASFALLGAGLIAMSFFLRKRARR